MAARRSAPAATRTSTLTADEVTSVPADPPIVAVPFELQGPENVVDRFANTAWATRWLDPVEPGLRGGARPRRVPAGADDRHVACVFEFAEPTDLGRIRILAGRPADDPSRGRCSGGPRVLELPSTTARARTSSSKTPASWRSTTSSTTTRRPSTIRIVGVSEPSEPSEAVEISEIVFDR